jgi:hypothetical protein
MLGDKAYDSAELREDLDERGTRPVIPNRCNRKQPFSFSKRLYKLRWRIESTTLADLLTPLLVANPFFSDAAVKEAPLSDWPCRIENHVST